MEHLKLKLTIAYDGTRYKGEDEESKPCPGPKGPREPRQSPQDEHGPCQEQVEHEGSNGKRPPCRQAAGFHR